jgi:chromosome segregation ATPase
MAKKVEAEGKAAQELFDKFGCYCKTGAADLSKSIGDNDAKVPELQSDIEEAEAKLATTKQELEQHQTERDAAKSAMAKATAIREKENKAYLAESGQLKATIDAVSKAIPAIEKGMAGGFLQSNAVASIRRAVLADSDLTDFDRDTLSAFLQGGALGEEGYVPKSGQIVGILKQMKDDFEKDLAAVEEQESNAQKVFDELMAAKTKEVQQHTEAIERKTALVGELSVEIVQMKNSLSEAEEALIEDKKFLGDLERDCGTKKKEFEEQVKVRAEELVAIQETIKILNDDDALELFKKTLPSPSLLQTRTFANSKKAHALSLIRAVRYGRPEIDFIALALNTGKVDFSKVLKMIDDMVEVLAKEQSDDDHKKEYCTGQIDLIEDKAKELGHSIEDGETEMADAQETLKTVEEELATLQEGIKTLDKSVQEATEQRKKENAEFTELMASDTAAKEILEFAKNRLNKFYNPKLYKPPPKRELTE